MVRVGFGLCLVFISICLVHVSLEAQSSLCGGNEGENIFFSGDFGSGPANVFPTDPGLAPGFSYTTAVPPDDGEYTLTSDMGRWAFVFGGWLRLSDNSPDPNGYMMVVNASFSPGVFYEQQIDGLCENTLYTFSADIANLIQAGAAGFIFPNVSFLLDDVTVFTTGNVPQDNQWHTYGATFTTAPGQTAVKLTLRNNAPGGIGNDLALDNITFNACGPNASITIDPPGKICENAIFPLLTAQIDADTGFVQWQLSLDEGLTWQDVPGATARTYQVPQLMAATYVYRFLYANTLASLANPRCRIVSDELPVEVIPVRYSVRDTLCEGLTYMFGDTLIRTSGTYLQELVAANGCDSIVTLDLVFVPDPGIEAIFDSRPPSCAGAADGLVFLVSVSGARPPFSFIVNDSIIPPPGTAALLPAGTYTVRIADPVGCYDEAEVVIPEGPPFIIDLSGDTSIDLGHSTLLTLTASLPPASITWTPEELVSCPFCPEVIATPFEDQWFVVTASTEAGCIDSAALLVRVDRTPVIYVPNVFTPDGNGINDAWWITLDPLNLPTIESVYVFDRWGGLFVRLNGLATTSQMSLWDGETPWGPAGPGTYVYLVVAKLADGETVRLSGDVTLIR